MRIGFAEQVMNVTISYIEEKFDEFNRLMFAGRLPRIPVCLTNVKTFVGQCACKKRLGADGKPEYYDFKLRINTRITLTEQELEDTLIHEMIHYYIFFNRLSDTSSHGQLFQRIMNEINRKFHRHISVSFKGTQAQREEAVDNRARYHVVAVVTLNNGSQGIKVLPRVVPKILHFHNTLLKDKRVSQIQLYISNHPFFNRFPCSSALKVHILESVEFYEYLSDARQMKCDGHKIELTSV